MNRLSKFVILSSALLSSQVSNATSSSSIITGWVMISTGISTTCNIEITINGNSVDVALTPGDVNCGVTTDIISGPTSITVSGNTVTLQDVTLTDAFGYPCSGTLTLFDDEADLLPGIDPLGPPGCLVQSGN